MSVSEMVDILGLTLPQFMAAAQERGVKAPRATALYRSAFRLGVADASWAALESAPIIARHEEGSTVKFIQELPGGLQTESVIIPMHGSGGRARRTLCVSSQVGCAMGCTFCETAQMGLMANLTPAQIIGQWFAARHRIGAAIDNIVFMGMGEPMENFEAVEQAIRVLTDHNGPRIAASKIAVSTVGHVKGIGRLADLMAERGFGQLNLAVSINAPGDAIRSRLMPINRAAPMAPLMEAMRSWQARTRRPVLIEYVLIPGVNDHASHAAEVCAYLRPLRCAVNVIPYNPRRDSPWLAPDEAAVEAFIAAIATTGQMVRRRQTRGRSMMGACGQLGNAGIRRRRAATLTVSA
jgi:23S rRNA (adenine2503-C2)-methyltransferase